MKRLISILLMVLCVSAAWGQSGTFTVVFDETAGGKYETFIEYDGETNKYTASADFAIGTPLYLKIQEQAGETLKYKITGGTTERYGVVGTIKNSEDKYEYGVCFFTGTYYDVDIAEGETITFYVGEDGVMVSDGWYYTIDNLLSGAVIQGFDLSVISDGRLVIPSYLDGKSVTSIEKLTASDDVLKISFAAGAYDGLSIDREAFKGYPNLSVLDMMSVPSFFTTPDEDWNYQFVFSAASVAVSIQVMTEEYSNMFDESVVDLRAYLVSEDGWRYVKNEENATFDIVGYEGEGGEVDVLVQLDEICEKHHTEYKLGKIIDDSQNGNEGTITKLIFDYVWTYGIELTALEKSTTKYTGLQEIKFKYIIDYFSMYADWYDYLYILKEYTVSFSKDENGYATSYESAYSKETAAENSFKMYEVTTSEATVPADVRGFFLGYEEAVDELTVTLEGKYTLETPFYRDLINSALYNTLNIVCNEESYDYLTEEFEGRATVSKVQAAKKYFYVTVEGGDMFFHRLKYDDIDVYSDPGIELVKDEGSIKTWRYTVEDGMDDEILLWFDFNEDKKNAIYELTCTKNGATVNADEHDDDYRISWEGETKEGDVYYVKYKKLCDMSDDRWLYQKGVEESIIIIGYDGTNKEIVVPSEIDGKTVTAVKFTDETYAGGYPLVGDVKYITSIDFSNTNATIEGLSYGNSGLFKNLSKVKFKYYDDALSMMTGSGPEVDYAKSTYEDKFVVAEDRNDGQIVVGLSEGLTDVYIELPNMNVVTLGNNDKVERIKVKFDGTYSIKPNAFDGLKNLYSVYFANGVDAASVRNEETGVGLNENVYAIIGEGYEQSIVEEDAYMMSANNKSTLEDGWELETNFKEESVKVVGYNGSDAVAEIPGNLCTVGWCFPVTEVSSIKNSEEKIGIEMLILPKEVSVSYADDLLTDGDGETANVTVVVPEGAELDETRLGALLRSATLVMAPADKIDDIREYDISNIIATGSIAVSGGSEAGEGEIMYDEESKTLQVVVDEDTNMSDIAGLVNSGAAIADNIIITLDNDINGDSETDAVWREIGTEEHPFKGIFDGNGYTVAKLGEAESLFGVIASDAKVRNLNVGEASVDEDGKVDSDVHIEAAEASEITAVVEDKDGTERTVSYYGVIAQKNEGLIKNVVFVGDFGLGDYVEADSLNVSLVADNENGTLDHCVAYFTNLKDAEEETTGNKRKIIVMQNVGVGRTAGHVIKTASNGKRRASTKAVTLGSMPKFKEEDINSDYRIYSDEEMATGEPAYWMNMSSQGYTGEYTGEWSMSSDGLFPVMADENHKKVVKIVYEVEGLSAMETEELELDGTAFAKVGSTATVTYQREPMAVEGVTATAGETGAQFGVPEPDEDGVVMVTLKYASLVTDVKTESAKTGRVTVSGRNITVSDVEGGLTVTDVMGRQVYSREEKMGDVTLRLPSAGIYMVKAGDVVEKVVVR